MKLHCPYNCENREFDLFDCITTNDKRLPEDGDFGMCSACAGWWEMKEGKLVAVEPTSEMLNLVYSQPVERFTRPKRKQRNEKERMDVH